MVAHVSKLTYGFDHLTRRGRANGILGFVSVRCRGGRASGGGTRFVSNTRELVMHLRVFLRRLVASSFG